MKTIHNMELHEVIKLDNGVIVLRVPEFWIYTFPNGACQKIPYSYEFSGKKRLKVTKDLVTKVISHHYKIPLDFYLKPNGRKPIGEAKRVLACILSEELKMTHEDIASFTNKKTHSNSITAVKNIKHEMKYNDKLATTYKEILIKIEQHRSTKNHI